MTKSQLKTEAMALLEGHKASKAFKEAMAQLMDEYAASANKSVEKHPDITIGDMEYKWCNRHEMYEPAVNFKPKAKDCRLAVAHWTFLGKAVNEADKAREKAIEEQNYEELPALNDALTAAKELRAGRYNLEDNKLQHAEVADYDYSLTTYEAAPEEK